jgi:ParB family chromosome partitioning protein
MDAFAEGLVTTNNFGQARRIIAARAKTSKKSTASREYTVGQLQHDIAETTRVKTSFVREAKSKENRFMTLLTGINTVFQDAALVELLVRQKLDKRPVLAGDFRFEQSAKTEVRS